MANGIDPQALGQIEGKLDMVIDLFSEARREQKTTSDRAVELAVEMRGFAALQLRVQELEKRQAYMAGAIAMAGFLGGIASWLVNTVMRKG